MRTSPRDHNSAQEMHQGLLSQISNAVKSFYDDLAADGWDDKVLAMTFSEFGRRVEQNSSDGTDHGAAAPMLFFGSALDGNGFLGDHPDLQEDLDFTGNLLNSVDFRQVYATIMEHWFCIDSELVNDTLMGDFTRLELGFNCIVGVPEIIPDGFLHMPVNQNDGDVLITFTLPKIMDVEIHVFNAMGQIVATVPRSTRFEGKHQVSVRQIAGQLATGQYTYRILANRKAYSKSFIYRSH